MAGTATNRVWTVPNLLSAARLGLALACFLLIGREAFLPALVAFLVAAGTD